MTSGLCRSRYARRKSLWDKRAPILPSAPSLLLKTGLWRADAIVRLARLTPRLNVSGAFAEPSPKTRRCMSRSSLVPPQDEPAHAPTRLFVRGRDRLSSARLILTRGIVGVESSFCVKRESRSELACLPKNARL